MTQAVPGIPYHPTPGTVAEHGPNRIQGEAHSCISASAWSMENQPMG